MAKETPQEREHREMMERIEADILRRRQKRDAEAAFGSPSDSIEDLDRNLRQENKKVAKGLGLFGWLFGDSEENQATDNDRHQARAERANKDSSVPIQPPTTRERTVSGEDTGLGDDGYMYRYVFWSDGSVDKERM